MFERTRFEGIFFVALVIGSAMAVLGHLAVRADGIRAMIVTFDAGSFLGLTAFWAFWGMVPMFLIGLPACFAVERRVAGAVPRTVLLTVGGAITGATISAWTVDFVIYWAISVGGCTGFALSLLRRRAATGSGHAPERG